MTRFVFIMLFFCSSAIAHEVKLETSRLEASVISLTYVDGNPFSFEAYELYLAGKNTLEQVGRTTAQGQVIFIAGNHSEWRIKSWSADGHGVDEKITLPGNQSFVMPIDGGTVIPRTSLFILGFGVLLALFGAWQLFCAKKKT